MTGIMHLNLKKLIKAMDGKAMNFFCKESGEPLSDKDARDIIAAYLTDRIDIVPLRKDDTIKIKKEFSNTKVARLRELVRKLEQDILDYMRKNNTLQAKPMMYAKLKAAKDELEEAERYAPQQLGKIISEEMLEKYGIRKQIVKVHLASDFLSDTAGELRDSLEACNVQHCSLYPIVADIRKKTADFTKLVCHPEFFALHDFFKENDKLLDALNYMCDQYIKDNLTINANEI